MDVDRIYRHRVKQSCEEFKAKIQPDDVSALASAYLGRPCHIFAQHKSGSYNRWVVRFPLPSVHDAREKLSSEVATMRHVATHTDIPIPRVHGYALGEDESNDGVANPTIDLPKLDPEKKTRFYGQLAHILGQMRLQELPAVGSLLLDETGAQPDAMRLGRPLSLDLNDQATEGLKPDLIVDRTYQSTADYSYALYRLLYNVFKRQRNSVYDETDARAQIFALEQYRRILLGWVLPEHNHGPFVLMHGDLRPSNIIIDEDFNIRAIIDWEWSRTVPLQFFIPPTWITGYDAHVVAGIGYNAGWALELHMMTTKSRRATMSRHLMNRSGPSQEGQMRMMSGATMGMGDAIVMTLPS
ncbi:MAG: hypothetical protein M1832_004782 [Thelocarpon impressellum]|nr:MAG: hypothetical protein M1832_004782 [Thelocarpon impressellum]